MYGVFFPFDIVAYSKDPFPCKVWHLLCGDQDIIIKISTGDDTANEPGIWL